MQRLKVGSAARITLPKEAWQKLGVAEGDYLEAEVVEEGVLLRPAPREPDAQVDVGITEGLEDLRAGRVTPAFQSMEEFESYRRTDGYKRLIRDDT